VTCKRRLTLTNAADLLAIQSTLLDVAATTGPRSTPDGRAEHRKLCHAAAACEKAEPYLCSQKQKKTKNRGKKKKKKE